MNKFIVLLMTASPLLFGVATQAEAKPFQPLVVGMKDNMDLATHIDASYARDPTGNGLITPGKCLSNGYSCGTPNMLIPLAYESAPERKGTLNKENFSAYVRSLKLVTNPDPPETERWMGCIVSATKKEKWNCMSRPYHPNEKVYADPVSMKPLLPLDCVNFIGDIVPRYDCNEIHFWLKASDEPHIGLLGPDALPDDVCRPALKKAGDSEWSLALLDECLRMNCDFSGPSEDLGLAVRNKPRISFKAEVTGEYILRVPRMVQKSSDVFVFCVLYPDGTQSQSTYITKTAYATFGWAYIDYTGAEAQSASARTKKGWHGLVHTWQRSDKRAFTGVRPPIK